MKKVFVIVGIVFIIFIIILGVLFFFQQKKSPVQTTSQQVFDFTLTSPQNWAGSYYSYTGGKVFMMKEKDSPDSDATPVFIIEQHPLSDLDSLNQRIKDSLTQGNTSEKITINSEEVNKVEGPLVYMLANKTNNTVLKISPASPVQEALMVYKFKDHIYFIEYKYGGSSKDPVKEQLFQGVLSSMKNY